MSQARPFDWRLGAVFGTYFATAGVLAPYLPLYLQHRGLTGFEIGVVLAMIQGMWLVGPSLWGYLADHSSHRQAILRGTALAACLALAPLLAPGGFWFVFAVLFAFNFFLTAQMPLAEAITAARLRGDPLAASRYGRLRAFGSVGFIALVLACGPLFDWAGIQWQPVVALIMLAVSALAAWQVRDRHHPDAAPVRVSVRARLAEPRVRWFFVSVALMVFAHGALYTYFSLYLAQLGYSKTAIGIFWVVGVVIEIAFFFSQGPIFKRFGAFNLLAAAFVLAALRFALIAELAHWWLVLLLAQVLHAASFAVHHSASILTVQQWFPGSAAARGQALYISIGYGLGGTAGSLVAAGLWSAVGPAAAFWSSSVAAIAGYFAVQRARRHDTVHGRAVAA